jgi:hypothetical protein
MTAAGPDPWDVPDPLSPDYVPAWAAQPTGGTTTMARQPNLIAWCGGCLSSVEPRRWNQDLYLCDTCATETKRFIRRWATGRVLHHLPLAAFIRTGGRPVRVSC